LSVKNEKLKYEAGVNLEGREADYSSASTAQVTNGGAIPPLLHKSSWLGA
jgi:hypothetical protein